MVWLNCEVAPGRDECIREMTAVFFGDRWERSRSRRAARVQDHLREGTSLVVLDNFETVAGDEAFLRWLKDVRARPA